MFEPLTKVFCMSLLLLPGIGLTQEERARLDGSQLPATASDAKAFVPAGWIVEEEVSGDLNGDRVPDLVLKLVEPKPADASEDDPVERQRALVVLLREEDTRLRLASVSDRLLQCTSCGGAFYGAAEAPAEVRIEKGVLIVEQAYGSRELTSETYRFRYEPSTAKLALIGFDLRSADRLNGRAVSESTNYLTGERIVTRSKGTKDSISKRRVETEKIYLEEIDKEQFASDAVERLDL